MIAPDLFFKCLQSAGVSFFAGVPDSLLKEFCAYVDAVLPPELHIITANEGSAVAVAAGYHLATDSVPLVYMQNSGLGNSVNPLLSLADADVYGLPIVLLVGWRGEPGVSHNTSSKVVLHRRCWTQWRFPIGCLTPMKMQP